MRSVGTNVKVCSNGQVHKEAMLGIESENGPEGEVEGSHVAFFLLASHLSHVAVCPS